MRISKINTPNSEALRGGSFLYVTTFLLFVFSFLNARSADFYWVGGSGNWSDFANHWATTSGGASFHANVPTSADNVIFDANSFADKDTVTLDGSFQDVNCLNMTWTGAGSVPVFKNNSTFNDLNVYGNLVLIAAMEVDINDASIYFKGTGTHTITTANQTIDADIVLDGSGQWTLIDSFKVQELDLVEGLFITDDKVIECTGLESDGFSTREIRGGTSVININSTSSYDLDFESVSNLTTDLDLTTINFTGSNQNMIMAGPSSGSVVLGTVTSVASSGDFGVYGNFTITTLSVGDVRNTLIQSGRTLTIATGGSMTINSSCSDWVGLKATTQGSEAFISTTPALSLDSITVEDINISSGSVTCDRCENVNNNTSVTFTNTKTVGDWYWIGDAGNWSDGTKWSRSSGGAAEGCVPSYADNAFFDDNSFTGNNTITLDASYSISTLDFSQITDGDKPVFAGASTLVVYGDFLLETGMTASKTGLFDFVGSGTKNISTSDVAIKSVMEFNTGTYHLESNLDLDESIIINSGKLDVQNEGATDIFSIYIEGAWQKNGGEFIERSSTADSVIFNGDGHSDYYDGVDTFFNVLINTGSVLDGVTILSSGDSMKVTGHLDIQSGELNPFSSGAHVEVTGKFSLRKSNALLDLYSGSFRFNNATSGDFVFSAGEINLSQSAAKFYYGDSTNAAQDNLVLTVGEGTNDDDAVIDINNGTFYVTDRMLLNSDAFLDIANGDLRVKTNGSDVNGNAAAKLELESGARLRTTGGDVHILGANADASEAIDFDAAASVASGDITGGTFHLKSYNTKDYLVDFNDLPIYNLVVNSSAETISLATNLNLNGSLTSTSGALNAVTFDIQVAGNWTNNDADGTGAFTPGTGKVIFDGGAAQTIGGTRTSTFGDVTINNTASEITLDTTVTITDDLVLTAGNIVSSWTDVLIMDEGAGHGNTNISGFSSSSFIAGPVTINNWASTNELQVPVGDGTHYAPVYITPSSTSNTAWTVRYADTSAYAKGSSICDSERLGRPSKEDRFYISKSGAADAKYRFYFNSNSGVANTDVWSNVMVSNWSAGSSCWDSLETAYTHSFASQYIETNSAVSNTGFFAFLIGGPFYVTTSGSDVTGVKGNSNYPFATLQHIYDNYNLGTGDSIIIAAGTYTEDGITSGANDESYVVTGASSITTIYDGNGTDRFLTVSTDGNKFEKFTVRDMAQTTDGAGIRLLTGASNTTISQMVFDSCILADNSDDGGGVFGQGTASGAIEKCIFKNNQAGEGPAIHWEASGNVSVTNCLMYENAGDFSILLQAGSGTMTVFNCTVTDNTGANADGVKCTDGTMDVTNTISVNNGDDDFYESTDGTMNMNYCMYDDVFSPTTNTNRVQATPRFVSAANDDYRLLYASPCRDAGTATGAPSDDLDGITRSTVDLGAYEWYCTGDADGGTLLSSQTICSHRTANLTNHSAEARYLKWQISSDNSSFADVSGAGDTTAMTTDSILSTRYYRMAASCDNTNWFYSDTATITINHQNWYVDDAGNNANAGTSSGAPLATLQAALDSCSCGDTIDILAGTYTEDDVTIDDGQIEIYIRGAGQDSTIFDGDYSDRFLNFAAGGNIRDILLSDITIKEMSSGATDGAGLYILGGTEITIEDVTFNSCTTSNNSSDGGAIAAANAASALIQRCRIFACDGGDGAAIQWEASGNVGVKNCLIYENVGDFSIVNHEGAGIMTMMNCTVADNDSGSDADGVKVQAGTLNATNTVSDNNADDDFYEGGTGTLNMNYCMYDNLFSPTTNTNRVQDNPRFKSRVNDDYDLMYASPLRDAGTGTGAPTVDINGYTRSTTDVGAFEWYCDAADGGTVLSSQTTCTRRPVSLTNHTFEAQYLKWQRSTDNSSFSDISGGADSNLYTTDSIVVTTYYRQAASCDNTNWFYSDTATITINHQNWYVDDAGNNANAGTSSGAPLATLQAALDSCSCGDTIDILAGTYTEDDVTIDDGQIEIYIRGAGQDETIFDGDGSDRFLNFAAGGNIRDIYLTDMTIKEMSSGATDGGGISILGGTEITIEDVRLSANTTSNNSSDGGGLFVGNAAEVLIQRCIFDANDGGDGAAIQWQSSGNGIIKNCLIYENIGDFSILNQDAAGGTLTIWNCTVVDNSSGSAADGIKCQDGTMNVTNTISVDNADDDFYEGSSGTLNMNYCIYGNLFSPTTNTNASTTPPTFLGAASDNYDLDPASEGVDDGLTAGAPIYDITGLARLGGANVVVDIGCYEQGNRAASIGASCSSTITWDGSAGDGLWSTTANWDLDMIPCGNPVIIPDLASDPTLDVTGDCGSLTINGAAVLTWSSNDSLLVADNLDLNSTAVINHTGSGVMLLSGTTKQILVDPGVTISTVPLTITGSYTADSTISVDSINVKSGGSLTIATTKTVTTGRGFTNAGTTTLTATADLNVDSSFINSGTFVINTGDLFVGKNFTNSSTFTVNTSTVHFDGSVNSVITDNDGISFNNLTVNKTATSDVVSCNSANDDVTVGGNFTNTEGTTSPGDADFTVTGTTTIDDGEFINTTGETNFGDVVMNNDGVIDSRGTLSADFLSISGDLDINGTAGMETSNSGTTNFILSGTKNIDVESTALTASQTAQITIFTGADRTLNDSWTIEDLWIMGTSATLDVTTNDTLSVKDSVHIESGGILLATGSADINIDSSLYIGGTAAINSGDLYIGKDFRNNGGTFNENTSTIHFDGDVDGKIVCSSGSETFNDFIIEKATSGDSILTDDNITVSDYTGTQGKFQLNASNLDVGGQATMNGGELYLTNGTLTADNADFDMNGGTLHVDAGTVDIDDNSANYDFDMDGGIVLADGGTWTIGDDFYLDGGKFEVNGATITIEDLNALSDNGVVMGAGELEMNAGSFTVGDGTSEWFDMNGGTVDINGGTLTSRSSFDMSAGNFDIEGGTLAVGAGQDGVFKISGGTYKLKGGTIDIQNYQSNGLGDNEVYITSGATTDTVNGGTIKFSASDGASTIDIAAGKPIWNLEVNTTNRTVDTERDLDINGNVLIETGTLSASNNDLTVAGNWTNNAADNGSAFVDGTGRVTFDGKSTQSIGGTNISEFYNVTVNKVSSNIDSLVIDTTVLVANGLALTSGKVVTTWGHKLIVDHQDAATNAISGGNDSTYIDGMVRLLDYSAGSMFGDTLKVPVGDGTLYNPVYVIPSGTNSSTWDIRYLDSAATDISTTKCVDNFENISINDRFQINRVSGTDDAKLRLYWNTTNMTIRQTFLSDLIILHYDTTNTCWEATNIDTALFTRNWSEQWIETDFAVDEFSPFAFGDVEGLAIDVPIKLISFNAILNPSKTRVDLTWATATEFNNDHFEVERWSKYNTETQVILKQQAVGNSFVRNDYQGVDFNPLEGISYYRLKQVDVDGTSTYSDIQAVINEGDASYELVFKGNEMMLVSNLSDDEMYDFEVIDMLGRVLYKNTATTNQIIDFGHLYFGVYFVNVQVANQQIQRKVLLGQD